MNMTYIISLAPAAGVLVIALVLLASSAHRRSRQLRLLVAASDEMRKTLMSVQSELSELKRSSVSPQPAPRSLVPSPVLTADQRAGALEMFRAGADAAEVSSALGIPHPDALLLQKVQRLIPSAIALS